MKIRREVYLDGGGSISLINDGETLLIEAEGMRTFGNAVTVGELSAIRDFIDTAIDEFDMREVVQNTDDN